jgi:hypothetical protein
MEIRLMARQSRLEFWRSQLYQQRKWIEKCEANGVSYADGERGQRIREADQAELARIEEEVTHHERQAKVSSR